MHAKIVMTPIFKGQAYFACRSSWFSTGRCVQAARRPSMRPNTASLRRVKNVP